MKMEDVIDGQMYVLVAPDGAPQVSTLSTSFISCVAMCETLAAFGMAKPLAALFDTGFVVLPVLVTMKQNGDENDAFKKKA